MQAASMVVVCGACNLKVTSHLSVGNVGKSTTEPSASSAGAINM